MSTEPTRSGRLPSTARRVRVAALPFDVRPGEVAANLASALAGLESAHRAGAALLVLPEKWTTSFLPAFDAAVRAASDAALARMHHEAAALGMVVLGSAPGGTGDKPWNEVHLLGAAGDLRPYRKRVLFSPTGEGRQCAAGDALPGTLPTALGRIAAVVCYDLRFPELTRRAFFDRADLLAVPAQWPSERADTFELLARARAAENQCWVLACNRSGRAALGAERVLDFPGTAFLFDPLGREIARSDGGDLLVGEADYEFAAEVRQRVPCERDARRSGLGPAADLRAAFLGLGGYVPERVLDNAEWERRLDTSDAWIVERTGIRERRVAADDQATVDLAEQAALVALADAGLAAGDLDEIIVATDTPEVRSPDTASFLQHRLGAREVPSYDLGASGCAGFVQALDVARARILEQDRKILVVGVELLTRLMNWADRGTAVLFGDAAGAAVLGRATDGRGLLAVRAGTDGSRSDILGLEVGGSRKPFTLARAQAGEHLDVVMKGREVFKEAVRRMCESSQEALAAAGLGIDDVDLLVPHQANRRILDAVARRLGIPEERVAINVDRYGNTGSASVPLALWEARRDGRVGPGSVVLLTAFGAGFHWASAVARL
ncbi:MAG TPA: beta-ketoacyl-ACP synthase 3 [Planctomycetota bacterium]